MSTRPNTLRGQVRSTKGLRSGLLRHSTFSPGASWASRSVMGLREAARGVFIVCHVPLALPLLVCQACLDGEKHCLSRKILDPYHALKRAHGLFPDIGFKLFGLVYVQKFTKEPWIGVAPEVFLNTFHSPPLTPLQFVPG